MLQRSEEISTNWNVDNNNNSKKRKTMDTEKQQTMHWCSFHKQNRSHNTEQCYFANKKQKPNSFDNKQKDIKPCWHCGESFTPQHKCAKKPKFSKYGKQSATKDKSNNLAVCTVQKTTSDTMDIDKVIDKVTELAVGKRKQTQSTRETNTYLVPVTLQ